VIVPEVVTGVLPMVYIGVVDVSLKPTLLTLPVEGTAQLPFNNGTLVDVPQFVPTHRAAMSAETAAVS